MPERGEQDWGEDRGSRPGRDRLLVVAFASAARALEAESDRWFLWIPVLFAGGVVTYFTLQTEPDPRIALALLVGALGLALSLRTAPLGLAVGGASLAFALGFADAKLRTELARAPVLTYQLRNVSVTGFIENHELRDKGRARLTLRVTALGDLTPASLPYRVRVTLPAKGNLISQTGTLVTLKATLNPPPEPVEPGGFDFARQAWFARLGATGYATSKVERLEEARALPFDLATWQSIDAIRVAINARVRRVLSGETGEIAVALITGEQGGISDEVKQAMRDSGLAHILSISGLHMVIVAGTVLWVVRALLALWPRLALGYPIKKWAAAAALATASFYLALSGAAVPTVRSWIMMSIVLVAVMLDRPALTMRNVALAALAILIVAPESLFDPSFEMSFAAVVALVALFEWLAGRERDGLADVSPFWRSLRKGGAIVTGAAFTTLVASTAIAPFAVYHFHRMTEYGLIANLLAAPVVSLVIMPMALLSLAVMPFGLETWPLHAMGFGIDAMVWIGQRVAAWPGAVTVLPQISGAALLLLVLGGLWLCLWRTRTRALGLVIAACGLALAPPSTRPDVLIDRDGETAALRSDGGSLIFPPATAAGYSADNWLLTDGDSRAAGAASSDAFKCDLLGCIGTVKGKIVALIRHPAALEEDCRLADIVIAPFTIGKRCGAARVIVDRHVLKEQGAHALYIEGLSIRTETVAELRGRRPWVPDRTLARADRPPAWTQTPTPGDNDRETDTPGRRPDGDLNR